MTGIHTEYMTDDTPIDDWLKACRSEQTQKIARYKGQANELLLQPR